MINKIKREIFDFFPSRILDRREFITDDMIQKVEEVRIRVGQPICIRNHIKEDFSEEVIKLS